MPEQPGTVPVQGKGTPRGWGSPVGRDFAGVVLPMELDVVHSAEESGIYDQRAALRAMITRAVPALGHRQSGVLRDAFDEAYRRAGILDNAGDSWSQPAPTFRDVQVIIETATYL